MLGRAVHGIQDKGRGSSVDELMLRAGWHDNEIACFDILVFARYGCFAFAGCEGEDLVNGVFLWGPQVSRER